MVPASSARKAAPNSSFNCRNGHFVPRAIEAALRYVSRTRQTAARGKLRKTCLPIICDYFCTQLSSADVVYALFVDRELIDVIETGSLAQGRRVPDVQEPLRPQVSALVLETTALRAKRRAHVPAPLRQRCNSGTTADRKLQVLLPAPGLRHHHQGCCYQVSWDLCCCLLSDCTRRLVHALQTKDTCLWCS